MKKALITGITGQDGSYLSELLLKLGYEVYGVMRRASTPNTGRIDGIINPESKANIFYGDLAQGIDSLIHDIKPDEIYNLAAQSHVKISFDVPLYTGDVVGLGAARILECLRRMKYKGRYYQASSSEMFGITPPPQNESRAFMPVSPYGCAKLYAYHMTRAYRMGYGLHANNGILFNHESERRGVNFVTRKITRAAVRIRLGLQDKVVLGNLDSLRDWGHSEDYVRAMYMIMQHDTPDDWVVATGYQYTVRDFVKKVFEYLGMDWEKYVVISDEYKRPNEVPSLCGDSTKIREKLGWEPLISFDEIIKRMVDSDWNEEIKNV